MKYKHRNFKKPAAPASAPVISADLIRNERFAEIVRIFKQTAPSKISERYLYAYALWRTGQPVLALINLWPLANKGQPDLINECEKIAQQIFRAENWPQLAAELPGELSADEFQTLYMALKGLMPHRQVFLRFQQHFLTCLWQRGEYERLERILKAQKEPQLNQALALRVENLSKLALLQADKKLISANVPAFIGQVLTGGASLIMRTTLYQQDIAAAMQALAAEIKYQYAQLTSQYQHKLSWSKEAFANLVNCETSIVTQVLMYALALSTAEQMQSVVLFPTPSYVFNNATTPGSAVQAFLTWLSNVDHELWHLYYQPETYKALLWALGGDKASLDNKPVKNLINQFQHRNPYLRLAFILRANMQQKSACSELVQLSDFKHLNTPPEFAPAASLFENLVLQSIQNRLNADNPLELAPEFWQLLLEFYPVWQAQPPGIKNHLILHELTLLHTDYTQLHSLKFNNLISMTQQLSEFKLEQQILALNQRQQDCWQFLALIKASSDKLLIKGLTDKAALQQHLTLIADSCCLLYADLPIELFTHLTALVTNKKINQLIKLRELLECEFDCACASCRQDLYRRELPALGTELGLALVALPELAAYTQAAAATAITQTIKTSGLAQADPFKILGVALDASKPFIMQQMMHLIQKSPEQMPVLRQAQSELFNPAQRFVQHYLRYLAFAEPVPTVDDGDDYRIAGGDTAPPLKLSLRHELLSVN